MRKSQSGVLGFTFALLCVGLIACGSDPLGTGSLTGDQLVSGSGEIIVSNAFGTLRLRCETRTGRSKISVDGNNLVVGTYSARVSSGASTATAPGMATVGDEVEFDFDSDPGDIAEGAIAIATDFIDMSATPQVSAQILDATGAVVLSAAGDCASATGNDRDGDDEDDGRDEAGEATFSNGSGALRLRCETRVVRGRSKISVDGKNLASGMYSANVFSGPNSASAGPFSTTGDEVEFDFDSDPGDIAGGATAIAGNFIDTSASPHVSAEIVATDGTVVVSGGVDCEVRND